MLVRKVQLLASTFYLQDVYLPIVENENVSFHRKHFLNQIWIEKTTVFNLWQYPITEFFQNFVQKISTQVHK